VWSPEIEVLNAFDAFERVSTQRELADPVTGEVTEQHHYKGWLYDHLELDDFPFDCQGLSIEITTRMDTGKVVFIRDPHQAEPTK